ncbi:MAG: AMP-binding protein [Limnobacter sp.]|nr:AMP-binding protein [Limnobacter sp.]
MKSRHSAAPAWVQGKALDQSVRTYKGMTLIDALLQASEQKNKGIFFIHDDGLQEKLTYAALLEQACELGAALQEKGIRQSEPVLLCLNNKKHFLTAFWACQLLGAQPVPMAAVTAPPSEGDVQRLLEVWRLLDSPKIIGFDESQLTFVPEKSALLRFDALKSAKPIDPAKQPKPQPDSTALMLLTSGSTGIPKLVKQSHNAILFRSQATWQHDCFSIEDVSLNFLPLDHVGGLVMFHLRDVWSQCEQIQASMDLFLENPAVWLDWIETLKVTVTWAPNFAFGLVNACAQTLGKGQRDLSRLRFILNGGEKIVAGTGPAFYVAVGAFWLEPPSHKTRLGHV